MRGTSQMQRGSKLLCHMAGAEVGDRSAALGVELCNACATPLQPYGTLVKPCGTGCGTRRCAEMPGFPRIFRVVKHVERVSAEVMG
jgi:hypothetical protein